MKINLKMLKDYITKENEIIFRTKTNKDFDILMKALKEIYNEDVPDTSIWKSYKNETCVRIRVKPFWDIGYCYTEWYREEYTNTNIYDLSFFYTNKTKNNKDNIFNTFNI